MVSRARLVVILAKTIMEVSKVMRRLLCTVMLAVMVAACSEMGAEGEQPIVTNNNHEMVIVAEEQTRTTLAEDESHALWNSTGEYIMAFQSIGTQTTAKRSSEGMLVGSKASFRVSFTRNTSATEYRYDAIYPSTAVTSTTSPNMSAVPLRLDGEQQPSATSYDDDADIMVALTATHSSQPSSLDMRFKRVVALAKMTITGLPSSAKISEVIFEAPAKRLTGSFKLNTATGEIASYTSTNSNVTLSYATPVSASTPIYFAVLPTELTAGDSFTVSVVADDKTYIREVTIPNGRSLGFLRGDLAKFSVDFSSVQPESPEVDMSSIAGNWHLTTWRGTTDLDISIYLSIDAAGGVVLYQKLDKAEWQRYNSTATFQSGIISGTYTSGSIGWSAAYYVAIDGDQMTWTDTLDSGDVSVYTRVDMLPDYLIHATPMSRKLVAEEGVRFL